MKNTISGTTEIQHDPTTGAWTKAYARPLAVAVVAIVWLLTTFVFFRGYVGTDDIFYARYAFLFHRPPMNHFEFRIPAVMAIRASFLTFGPSEVAAALPTLLASLGILASVAWFVGWPTKLNWQTQASMLLAATFPMDLGFRSIPGATYFSSGFLAIGTVCLLKGGKRTQFLGAAFLSLAFVTHEITFFYTAILCLTALAFDRERFWRPVLACIVISACAVIIECATYQVLLGDPLARFRTSAGTTTNLPTGYDPDTGIGGVRFFTWPVIENLVVSNSFGLYLLILLLSGIAAWKNLAKEQRILFATVFLTWAWLGYGTQVPWAYKPLYRQIHYYGFIVFGVSALLPATLGYLFAIRRRLGYGVVVAAVAVHLACFTVGGHWGQDMGVSRQLLRYAREHGDQVFVTDVATMNHMYALSGFQLPENVVCVNGPAVERHLRVNKEPAGTPKFSFPELPVDGVLVNLERLNGRGAEAEFVRYLNEHQGNRTRIAPVRYRLACRPLLAFIEPRDFMVKSLGGEVVQVTKTPPSAPDTRPQDQTK